MFRHRPTRGMSMWRSFKLLPVLFQPPGNKQFLFFSGQTIKITSCSKTFCQASKCTLHKTFSNNLLIYLPWKVFFTENYKFVFESSKIENFIAFDKIDKKTGLEGLALLHTNIKICYMKGLAFRKSIAIIFIWKCVL